jgi:Xaa-Pro aminopeptidase
VTLPVPADFAPPPGLGTRARWLDAEREHLPGRLERLRASMAEAGVDAYFGAKPAHMRWLTGFTLAPGDDSARHSGQFLVGSDDVTVVTDSRYTIQARRQVRDAGIEEIGGDLADVWPGLLDRIGATRVAVEESALSHAAWRRLSDAAPAVELVAADGWVEAMRAVKAPDEIERVAAACAVADRALAALLPEIVPGVTEHDLAMRLEWLIRTGGAEALAFDVACLAGPEAALPHGSPGDRPVLAGSVLLFDFGAMVEGYRSDMTRTLFVGEPAGRDRAVYELVLRAQRAAIDAIQAGVLAGTPPDGRGVDALARGVIDDDGRWPAYGHGLGHGIGLDVHEAPNLSRAAPETPLPSPTVFSVEPGIYLEGETGVRIEDLVHVDVERGLVERLTRFPREVIVLEG